MNIVLIDFPEPDIEILTSLFTSIEKKHPEAVAAVFTTTIDGLMAPVVPGSGIYNKETIMQVIEERYISFRGEKDV